jgi:hypothetical protein
MEEYMVYIYIYTTNKYTTNIYNIYTTNIYIYILLIYIYISLFISSKIDAVSAALAHHEGLKVYGVGVTHVPRSGKPQELLHHYGLDSEGICRKVRELL